MLKYLSHDIAGATFHPVTLLPSIKPYKNGEVDGDNRYGMIQARKDNPDGLPTHMSCIVHVSRELRDDISECYFPGGYSINFYQQANFDWLVSFKANDILASKYLRMKNEDVLKLIREGIMESFLAEARATSDEEDE